MDLNIAKRRVRRPIPLCRSMPLRLWRAAAGIGEAALT
jgi:hypothetical protein